MKKKPLAKSAQFKTVMDPSLARMLSLALITYYVLFATIAALIGRDLALWLAAPLSIVPTFIIDMCVQSRPRQQDATWRDLLKFPRFNYWNITWIVVTISFIQLIGGILYILYAATKRRAFLESLPDNFLDSIEAFGDDYMSVTIFMVIGFFSYLGGGYIAAKLPNYKCPSPYRHAVAGSFVFNLLSSFFVGSLVYSSGEADKFTEEDLGGIILYASPYFIFSILGVWVAMRKQKSYRGKGYLVQSIDESDISPAPIPTPHDQVIVSNNFHPIAKSAKFNPRLKKHKKRKRRR
jgi:hypothetical protein